VSWTEIKRKQSLSLICPDERNAFNGFVIRSKGLKGENYNAFVVR